MKKVFKILIAMLIIFNISIASVFASNDYKLNKDIKNKINFNLNQNEEVKESKITDGIIMSREEFNEYLKNKDKVISTRSVPNDGYIYVFDYLYITNTKRKDYFRYLGHFTTRNKTGSNMNVRYEQENTKTVRWDVAGSISGNTTIGNSFLGKIEVEVGVSVSRSSTTSSNTRLGAYATCPPWHILTLTAYQGGVYADAVTVYSKYHSSGASVGVYTETVSGTVIEDNAYTIDATEEEL